jgi:hypothetical protein
MYPQHNNNNTKIKSNKNWGKKITKTAVFSCPHT